MRPLEDLYKAFLRLIDTDEWDDLSTEDLVKEAMSDWFDLYQSALLLFKFPNTGLETEDNENFKNNVSDAEINVLAEYMKYEFLDRLCTSWENTKTMYHEKDFSSANLLKSLNETVKRAERKAISKEKAFYRKLEIHSDCTQN